MAIIAKDGGSTYKPAPAGTHQGVCVDVVDEGIHTSEFDGRTRALHKVTVHWQIPEDREDGKRFIVQKWYTLSLNERANLRKDLESWRGKAFSAEELKGFDVEKLIGANCLLAVIHTERNGRTYADVQAVMALPKGMPKLEAADNYVRIKDRPDAAPAAEPGADDAPGYDDYEAPPLGDDDLPF